MAGNLTNFNGTALTYDGGKPHAANKRGGVDRYDYDANGNMTVRNKGLSSQQTLAWDHENRLASLSGGGVSESYLYDDGGRRVKKVSGGTTWYYPFPQYEVVEETAIALPATSAYGKIAGGDQTHINQVDYTFDGRAGAVTIVFDAYDIDFSDEVDVLINGVRVTSVPVNPTVAAASPAQGDGALGPDANNAWTGPNYVTLPDNLVNNSGRNVLTFSNTYNPPNSYFWGVRNVRTVSAVASAVPGRAMTTTQAVQVYLPQVNRAADAPAPEGNVGEEAINAEESTADTAQAAIVAGGSPSVTKYYLFNGQRLAMTVNGVLRYLHADQLGSTVLTTYTSAARESERGYYAFGSDRRVVGTPATDHRFTGQKVDGTGLYYYNARYYDPVIGQFVSPDTIVPAPGRVFAYNRYMYVMGNPLKYNDPSGHETSKPNWWPKYLPYTLDLPDEWSYEGFVEWAGENNIPTAVGGQAGGSVTSGFGVHATFSGEAQGTINWLSGEFMWSWNNSAGTRAGTPVNGGSLSLGMSAHYNASTVRQLEGASLFGAVDAEADLGVRVGGQASFSRAVEFADDNGNGQFDMLEGEGAYFSPALDPVFNTPIDSLSANLVGGFDVTPNLVEGGFSTGISDTNRVIRVDLYAPLRRVSSWIGGAQ